MESDPVHGSQRIFTVHPQRLLLLRELLLQRRQLLVRQVDRRALAGDLVDRPVLDLAGTIRSAAWAFEYLKDIHTLDMGGCTQITDAALEHLRGISIFKLIARRSP